MQFNLAATQLPIAITVLCNCSSSNCNTVYVPDISNVVASQQVACVADHSMEAVRCTTIGSLKWPFLPLALPLPANTWHCALRIAPAPDTSSFSTQKAAILTPKCYPSIKGNYPGIRRQLSEHPKALGRDQKAGSLSGGLILSVHCLKCRHTGIC